jgi:hypothetical protein
VLSKMEGGLSAPLSVRLLLFIALPAAGWLTTNAPRPPSTAPQVGLGVRNKPLLCLDLREPGRGDAAPSRRWTAESAGLDRVWPPGEKGGAFPDAGWGGSPERERKEGVQASLKVWSRLRPSNLSFLAPLESVRILPGFAVENA